MRITLNLASRPFVELRPLYRRLRVWMLILLVLALPLWLLLRSAQSKAVAATNQARMLAGNVQRLQQQEQSYQALMREPQNAAMLTQSDFLNQLFRRKAFSWTSVMTDLETVLPGGVQVLSIEPTVTPSGDITIRMRVSGGRERAVELIRNLEHSRHFADPRLATESLATSNAGNGSIQPVSGPADVNFDILAGYRPLSPIDRATTKDQPATKGSDAGSDHPANGPVDASKMRRPSKPRIRPTAPAAPVTHPPTSGGPTQQKHRQAAKAAGGTQ